MNDHKFRFVKIEIFRDHPNCVIDIKKLEGKLILPF